MPTKPDPQCLAWSYSRLGDYESCPAKFKFKHLDKLPEPGSPAMERGSLIHKIAERYSLGELKTRPPELQYFAKEFAGLKRLRKSLRTEQQLALDRAWEPIGWFDAGAWLRVVLDCYYIAEDCTYVIDYKTGKVREENAAQLELYALTMFAQVNTSGMVNAQLWYLDQGELVTRVYERADVPALKRKWSKRSLPLLKDRTFAPTPGRACMWCTYSKAKGGPCAF